MFISNSSSAAECCCWLQCSLALRCLWINSSGTPARSPTLPLCRRLCPQGYFCILPLAPAPCHMPQSPPAVDRIPNGKTFFIAAKIDCCNWCLLRAWAAHAFLSFMGPQVLLTGSLFDIVGGPFCWEIFKVRVDTSISVPQIQRTHAKFC